MSEHDGRSIGERVGLPATVLAPTGELDLAVAPELESQLLAVPADVDLVLDLSSATFVDSVILSLFVRSARRHSDRGATLVLAAPAPIVRRVLTTTRLDDVLRCTETVAEAQRLLDQMAVRDV